MDRKKKKAETTKNALNLAKQRKEMKELFIGRTREIIKIIGGQEMLDFFPFGFFESLYDCRYTSLKPKAAPGSETPKTRVVQFHKLMHELLEGVDITIPNGNKIPLKWYLSEAQTLVDAIASLDPKDDGPLTDLKKQFAPFLTGGKIHQEVQNLLVDLVTRICVFFSDYGDAIYQGNLMMTPYFSEYSPENYIYLHAFKTPVEQIMTGKGLRPAVRLGWVNGDLEWQYFKVKPSALGFDMRGLDIPLDLYISKHTLLRLKERVNLTPGIMHEILFYTFLEQKIPHRKIGNDCLVEYQLLGQKVGYFLVRLYEHKFMIHTFLFLTNNHTPEGERLNSLLGMEIADKKYLEIDNLPDFNAYHIDQNEQLSKMFKNAGCGSLLKLGHLQAFTADEVADKDPESITRYLRDARYFADPAESDG